MKRQIWTMVGLAFLAVLLSGCASDVGSFRRATETKTIVGYDAYLKDFPEGKFIAQAKEKKEQLVELEALKRAKSQNTLAGWQEHFKVYPKGYHHKEAVKDFGSFEYRVFEQARKTDTMDAYQAYLRDFPNGTYVKSARDSIEKLVWQKARDESTIASYQSYLKEYPRGAFADQAKKSVGILEEGENWQKAKRLHTPEAYRNFLTAYRSTIHRDEVQKILKEFETADWDKAVKADSIEAYGDYMRKWPKGEYVAKAEETIADLKWKKAQKENTLSAYTEFLAAYPKSPKVTEARERLAKLYQINDTEIDRLSGVIGSDKAKVNQPEIALKLIFSGSNLLNERAGWTDEKKARKIYDLIKRLDVPVVTKALTDAVITKVQRLQVLFLVVKLGINGTEESLNNLLLQMGDKPMAEDYLNSGSTKLREGGRAWGAARGYRIMTGPGSSRVGWGRF